MAPLTSMSQAAVEPEQLGGPGAGLDLEVTTLLCGQSCPHKTLLSNTLAQKDTE